MDRPSFFQWLQIKLVYTTTFSALSRFQSDGISWLQFLINGILITMSIRQNHILMLRIITIVPVIWVPTLNKYIKYR